jgi:hypothetical protein
MRRSGRYFRKLALLAALPLGLMGFGGQGRADVVTDVNTQLLNIVANSSPGLIDGPPNVAREIAMVDGAMFDAVNAATGSTYQSLYYTGGAVSNASAQAAALSAAYTVMNNLYGPGSLYDTYKGVTGTNFYGSSSPYAGTGVGPSLTQYAAMQVDIAVIGAQLSALASSPQVTNGTALGTAVANAMIVGRATDNGAAAMLSTLTPYVPADSGTTPGVYVPPASRPALEPSAGTVTPFVATTGQIAAAIAATMPGPAALASAAYALQLLQTECQGSSVALSTSIAAKCTANGFVPQTAAQATAALYWNDPGGTYQPPGHLLQIADAAASQTGLGLLQHAQEDALVGAAMSDAGAAAWSGKFADNRWRPITAITDCSVAWAALNPNFTTCDPTWNSLIATPPHPDYVAGHPAFSGAAATVLDYFFGTDAVQVTVASQAYCNAGSATRDEAGNTIACSIGSTTYSIANASDCNNAGTQPPLLADFTANPLYNGSPLICPISVTFAGFQAASSGDLGSTFSRVAGGIHSPQAVTDALALGNAIGAVVAADAGISNNPNIPEPGTLAVFAVALAGVAMSRRRGVLAMVR